MKKLGAGLGIVLFLALLSWSYYLPTNASLEKQKENVNTVLSKEKVQVLAVAALMACLWISEAIPIPATSLIPLAMFPILGIMGTKAVGPAYADSMVLLLMGGFFIALVIEKVHLHKRIALNVIYYVGTNPRQLLLGFILATAMLSMWISNTATTLMMFPIALAVVAKLTEKSTDKRLSAAFLLAIAYAASIGGVGTPIGTPPNLIMRKHYEGTQKEFLLLSEKYIKEKEEFLLKVKTPDNNSIAVYLYQNLSENMKEELRSNRGMDSDSLTLLLDEMNAIIQNNNLCAKETLDIANLSEKERNFVDEIQNSVDEVTTKKILLHNRLLLDIHYSEEVLSPCIQVKEISFASWMAVAIPMVVILLFIMWRYLIWQFALPKKGNSESSQVIQDELENLGKMSGPEKITSILFLVTSCLWIFRKSIDLSFVTIPGWSSFFGLGNCDDTTVAIFMALVMFSVPIGKGEKLLDWETAVKIPWGMLLLFGGGIALAKGFDQSGLSEWLADHLQYLSVLPAIMLVLIVCFFMTFVTEITSNTAITTVMMPILASTSVALHIHPAFLMMPAAISASFAFMLPVATAPNAIVYGSGKFSIATMAKTGFILNILGVLIVTFISYFLGNIFIF